MMDSTIPKLILSYPVHARLLLGEFSRILLCRNIYFPIVHNDTEVVLHLLAVRFVRRIVVL